MVVRAANGTSLFLHSKEGVTRGDPIFMVTYGILLLPLIRALKDELLDINQPWYADAAGAGGTFQGIRAYFEGAYLEKLQDEKGYNRGYFWNP